MPTTPTGLLIIRAWIEEGSTEPLRAHIRVTDDLSNGIERIVTLTRSAPVGELVDAWIQRIIDAAAPDAA